MKIKINKCGPTKLAQHREARPNLLDKAERCFSKVRNGIITAMVGISTAAAIAVPVSASGTTVKADVNMENLFGGIVDIIIKMASYVGIVMVIGGIFSLILAYQNENADKQANAIRSIVVGASLMGLRVFLQMAGIIG